MENTNTVTISLDEYRELVSNAAKVEVFKKYVSTGEYVNIKMCETILGFEVNGDGVSN